MKDSELARVEIIQDLVNLSRADWKYTDLYLADAEEILSQLMTREQFHGLIQERELIPKLAADLRRAVQRADWQKAEQLAQRGERIQGRIRQKTTLLSLAEAVHGERTIAANVTALALSGAVSQPTRTLESDLSHLRSQLRDLAAREVPHRALYQLRAAEFERLSLESEEKLAQQVDPAELKQAAIRASANEDFAAVLKLTRSSSWGRQDRHGRVRAPRPASAWVDRLADPISDRTVERGRGLGLEAVALEPQQWLNAYLSCCCAEHPIAPSAPLTEGSRRLEGCTCGHACPPETSESLKATLDALMSHPFVTSGGTRYLPWFGAEAMLVESFSEDQPDLPTELLTALSLPHRRGLPRLAIENALLSKGPEICADLGLRRNEYRVTCIPFDAYNRLADRFEWGRRQLWTHFDGYQVTSDLHLQALIGGDVRYGGADDLCSVGRDYGSEHITARFAVIRRARFEAREPRTEEV